MDDLEEAILEDGPEDGKMVVCNREYGDFINVAMPGKLRPHTGSRDTNYFGYARTDRTKNGRQVYTFAGPGRIVQ